MIQISQYKIHPKDDLHLIENLSKDFQIKIDEIKKIHILKKSIDARKKPDIFYVYTLDIQLPDSVEEKLIKRNKNIIRIKRDNSYCIPASGSKIMKNRPVIIGAGPAGLFCAYLLAQKGYKPIIIERGEAVEDRKKSVECFWETGKLNTNSNVQFGEGGAGTFSDGKLNTGVKDKSGRNAYILKTFVEFGADENILYESKPHIGTDILICVIQKMRKHLEELGVTFYFSHQFLMFEMDSERNINGIKIRNLKEGLDFVLPATCCILAIGHSARDTFLQLYENKFFIEQKPFAVGLRVIHSQDYINQCQYGSDYSEKYQNLLPASPYKLTANTENGRGVYSFCMCPGGYVVNASSQEDSLAVNGMSYSKRDSGYANSAIVVSISPDDFENDHPLSGMFLQQELEKKAYHYAAGKIPVQYFDDFVNKRNIKTINNELSGAIKGDYEFTDLSDLFAENIRKAFIEGMLHFNEIMKGFTETNPLLCAIESRTSSPIKIPRNDQFVCINTPGVYPCGEGAGYAGGIMSAAMDGMKVAESIISLYAPLKT